MFNLANADIGCGENIDGKTDAELNLILQKCEEEIGEQKNLLEEKQRDSVTKERDIAILGYKIQQSQSDIRAQNIKINRLGSDIYKKSLELSELTEKTDETKTSISKLIRKANELDTYSFTEAVFSSKSISDFFIDVDSFSFLKNKLQASIVEMRNIKEQTSEEKEVLEETEDYERGLKLKKEKLKKQIERDQGERQQLLDLNRDEESAYMQSIAEKEKINQEIRDRIFRTVGGTELRFEDALKLILPFEEKTGVDSALVLAVLTQESAIDGIIGKNIGRCTYNQKNSHGNNKYGWTVMSNSQKESFLAIMKGLKMNPETVKVSCPIPTDGSYGGAMGPAQFMPNTWWDVKNETGYKKRVSKILNISNPSPFNNVEAFAGTASYLSDALRRCETAFSRKFDLWSCTSAKYYSGLYNTTDRSLLKHMRPTYSYGYKVAKRAEQFQKDIDSLGL
ncbi:hypothetical protein ACFLY7_01445 [Patescibacteria group bacterium]